VFRITINAADAARLFQPWIFHLIVAVAVYL